MGLFDQFSRFYTTSKTGPIPDRLNSRYEAIIGRNKDQLVGKRVLDIASHDGRWSFAALRAGASYVHGIEPRKELIDNAKSTFSHYGVAESSYAFECGDVFDCIHGKQFDVVFCLGFYYHTIRHAELLDLIERTGAKLIVIDTEVTPTVDEIPAKPSNDPRIVYQNPYVIQLLLDPVDDEKMAWVDSLTRNGQTIVGRPSRAAIEFLARHFGFKCELFDWRGFFANNELARSAMVDYDEGWRDTFFLSRH